MITIFLARHARALSNAKRDDHHLSRTLCARIEIWLLLHAVPIFLTKNHLAAFTRSPDFSNEKSALLRPARRHRKTTRHRQVNVSQIVT